MPNIFCNYLTLFGMHSRTSPEVESGRIEKGLVNVLCLPIDCNLTWRPKWRSISFYWFSCNIFLICSPEKWMQNWWPRTLLWPGQGLGWDCWAFSLDLGNLGGKYRLSGWSPHTHIHTCARTRSWWGWRRRRWTLFKNSTQLKFCVACKANEQRFMQKEKKRDK